MKMFWASLIVAICLILAGCGDDSPRTITSTDVAIVVDVGSRSTHITLNLFQAEGSYDVAVVSTNDSGSVRGVWTTTYHYKATDSRVQRITVDHVRYVLVNYKNNGVERYTEVYLD